MRLKHRPSDKLLSWLAIVVMLVLFCGTKADINKDKEQCADQLVGLATCLPYVGGEVKDLPMDCCTGLKQVLKNSRVCLCILIKDHNDPSLGLKINDTLALGLPDSCNTPNNISECVGLLHLQPGSPDAKVFEDYAKAIKSKNSTIVLPAGDNAMKANTTSSDGGTRKTWFRMKIASLLSIIVMLLQCHVSIEIYC